MEHKIASLGELQLQIMQILWRRGEAAVATVREDLTGPSGLAYTTVATMLRRMEATGLVTHRIEGRNYIYRAVVKQEQVTRTMTDYFVNRLFVGSLTEVVSHLLSTREVSKYELEMLERLVAERKKVV